MNNHLRAMQLDSHLIDVVATTMNFLGTAWLARQYVSDAVNHDTAAFLWEWVEVWRDDGLKTISFIAIGLFTLVGIPYTLKFLWAPVMDLYVAPWLGRRRGWMLNDVAASCSRQSFGGW